MQYELFVSIGTHWLWEITKMLKKGEATADNMPKESAQIEFFTPSVIKTIHEQDLSTFTTHFPLWTLPKTCYCNNKLGELAYRVSWKKLLVKKFIIARPANVKQQKGRIVMEWSCFLRSMEVVAADDCLWLRVDSLHDWWKGNNSKFA